MHRLRHVSGLGALLVVDIFLEFCAICLCLTDGGSVRCLFGENGAGEAIVPFCTCRNGCLGVLWGNGTEPYIF